MTDRLQSARWNRWVAALAAAVLLACGIGLASQSRQPDAYHMFSECASDGFWHVVVDAYYVNGDGSLTKVRIHNERTDQPCRDAAGQSLPEPPKVRQRLGDLRQSVEMSAQDYQVGVRDGEITELRCEGETFKRYHYDRYRMPDGTVRRHHTPTRVEDTHVLCTEPPPPVVPDRTVIDGGTAEGVGSTGADGRPPPVKLGDPVVIPGGGPHRGDLRLNLPGAPIADTATGAFVSTSGPAVTPAQVTNVDATSKGKPADGTQRMGATMLSYGENQVVISENLSPSQPWLDGAQGWVFRRPSVALDVPPWASAGPGRMRAARRPSVPHGDVAGPLRVVFASTGESSGDAMTMTVVNNGPEALSLLASGFVLEPLGNVNGGQVQRALASLKGRRTTVTVSTYCLEMLKAPPVPGMIYRLAPPAVQRQYATLGRLMDASRQLKDAGGLHPDSDPVQYFHSIRQWAIWSAERGFKDVDAFGQAFVDHAHKNYAESGQAWTRQIEDAVRGLVPGRWQDIRKVMDAAAGR